MLLYAYTCTCIINDISRRKLDNDKHVRYNHEQATCIAVGFLKKIILQPTHIMTSNNWILVNPCDISVCSDVSATRESLCSVQYPSFLANHVTSVNYCTTE